MAELFEKWSAYRKLLTHDYMAHTHFFQALESELNDRFRAGISILDLGCGDASPARSLLHRLDVRLYHGVDEAESVLGKADDNLASMGVPYALYPGDLSALPGGLAGNYDVILASYALHHLTPTTRKQAALHDFRELLSPAGVMAIIDVFSEDGESRESYLDRWEKNARTHFTELSPGELELIIDHVRRYDFPESFSTYRRIGRAAGYRKVVSKTWDKPRLNRLITLE
jgi:ubiquinone/menaquinone biosynthesis C-methylase UbiE